MAASESKLQRLEPSSPRDQEPKRAGVRLGWLDKFPVLRTAALILAVTATDGCGKEEAPVTTAKAFAAAAQRGDSKAMLGLIDAQAVAHLEASAERASDQIGGRRNVEPHEMLEIIDIDPRFQVARADLVESTETTANVKLVGADGVEHLLELTREDDGWRVVVPVPRSPTSDS